MFVLPARGLSRWSSRTRRDGEQLARRLSQALRVRIAPFGVVPGQFAQLLMLYERDGLTQAALCALLQVEQPTMANTLSRMHRDGLISARSVNRTR